MMFRRSLTTPQVIFDPKLVFKLILRRRNTDAAPGLSGWTESLILPLLPHKDLLEAFTTLLQDIAAGNLSDQARQLLLTSSLVPTKKGDDGKGVRPIAVSETFVKLSTLYLLDSLPANTLTNILAPLGCGSPGGPEVAIHLAQANIIMAFQLFQHHPLSHSGD